jgi:hypothetical protein
MTGDISDRWFQRRQRALIWESPTKWEAVPIDTMNAGSSAAARRASRSTRSKPRSLGTYRIGPTLVVPLMPGRLAPDLALGRPGAHFADIPLAFTLEMVQ